jgi:hypothetical protein
MNYEQGQEMAQELILALQEHHSGNQALHLLYKAAEPGDTMFWRGFAEATLEAVGGLREVVHELQTGKNGAVNIKPTGPRMERGDGVEFRYTDGICVNCGHPNSLVEIWITGPSAFPIGSPAHYFQCNECGTGFEAGGTDASPEE